MYFFSDDCRLNPIDASPSYCTGSPYTQMTVCHLDKLEGHTADPNMQQHISLNSIILAHTHPGAVFHPLRPAVRRVSKRPQKHGDMEMLTLLPLPNHKLHHHLREKRLHTSPPKVPLSVKCQAVLLVPRLVK